MLLVTIAYHVNQFQQHLSIFFEVCQQITLYKFKLYKYSDLKYVYIVKMVTNVRLVNTHITSHSQNLGGRVMVRNLKTYSLSNFQIYNIVLLTITTTLYSTSPGLIHLITGSLYSFTHISSLQSPVCPHCLVITTILPSFSITSAFQIPHISEMIVVVVQSPNHVWLFETPWTVACPTPLSMGFSRQEYCSGLPFPSVGDLPDPGIESISPAWQGGFFATESPVKPK